MSDDDEVRALIVAYATHADDGDTDAFAALFLPNAQLRTSAADGTVGSEYEGVEQIAAIPTKLRAAYDSTTHLIGRGSVTVEATGAHAATFAIATTDCEAHHRKGAVDRVMTIRYEDTFGRDDDGRWRFASREVRILAVDQRRVAP